VTPVSNFVLNVDDANRQYLGELFGHVWMLEGVLKRWEHLLGEFARTVDRAAARVLTEQVSTSSSRSFRHA